WRATIIARETGWLPIEGRRGVDAHLASILTTVGDKRLAAEARRLAQAWDPAAAVTHLRRAESGRCVTLRPAPDAMVYLTALLPLVQGIAAYAALTTHANTLIGTGQAGHKTRGQVMADTLTERLTGQDTAAAVPVEVHLIMTDTALLGGDSEPAWVAGHGPLPAATARDLLSPDHDAPSGKTRAWIRRLYTTPTTGHLVAMDSTRRTFDGLLRRMITLRDDTCRTPWCDAPIRHIDHATPHAAGGPTSYTNASGLCERCNHTKETPGWHHTTTPDHLTVTTPTGHTHTRDTLPLTPPRHPPGRPPARHDPHSPAEATLHHHIDIHWLPHAS
ncbi:MAG: HNH endonuclease, partial [Actinobacteria bacterium]|nr:HNH endonuclease [Actinomycetota bacterium]